MLPMLQMSFLLVLFFYECCGIYRIDSNLNNLLIKNVKIKVLRNIILPLLLNVFEACLVPPREDYRILKNRALCRIFALTREEVTGGCRNCMLSYIIFIFKCT